MIKKFSLYIGLAFFSLNIINGNLYSLYSYLRQRIDINTIVSEKTKICEPLQKNIEDYISNFRNNISISILNESGEFIVDINSKLPRIPASNQKILSSAFALDKLGPDYVLKTSLMKLSTGEFYINASGDPDLDSSHLKQLISELNSYKDISVNKIPIVIKALRPNKWWPSSWSFSDRKEEYGAPITKYSIASNASINALNNPTENFINVLGMTIKRQNLSGKFFIKSVNQNYPINYISTINTIDSAPLYILLNLVNSESHNFTSEVIFRHSLNNWSHDFPNSIYSKWLNDQNFNSENFIFADASGLSRKNKVTTYGLAQFLRRMQFNRFSDYYFSSFSIIGIRGSLANVKAPINLKGKILAKSGTLNNVRSVSGVFIENGKIFSIIVNNMDNSLKYIIDILSIVDNTNYCP